ncbi:MAG: hypothetical protein HA496_01060 [Thaumarchaeota archaeon]|jgi:hypothetical protein|nr:hypothetical protein [Nitrososphaerota archaeon]
MVKKASTKLYVLNKKLGGKTYSATMLYLPSKIVNDSAFPLKKKGRLIVKIVGSKIVIENEKKGRGKP